MVIAIDFDGTIVKHEYPEIGADVGAIRVMKELMAEKHKLILYTMRTGKELNAAVKYCEDKGVEFYGVNVNPAQKAWSKSPKIYANIYIDDAALGTPLKQDDLKERSYVDWDEIRKLLVKEEYLTF